MTARKLIPISLKKSNQLNNPQLTSAQEDSIQQEISRLKNRKDGLKEAIEALDQAKKCVT